MPDDLPDRRGRAASRATSSDQSRCAISNAVAAPSRDERGDPVEPLARGTRAARRSARGGRRSSGRGRGSSVASCIASVLRRLPRYSSSARRRSSPGSSVGMISAPGGDVREQVVADERAPSRRRRRRACRSCCARAGRRRAASGRRPRSCRRRARTRSVVKSALSRMMCSKNGSLAAITLAGRRARHQRLAEAVLGARALVVADAPLRPCPRCAATRAPERSLIACREARVVEVVVREQDELDVLERVAVRLRALPRALRAPRRSPARRRRA